MRATGPEDLQRPEACSSSRSPTTWAPPISATRSPRAPGRSSSWWAPSTSGRASGCSTSAADPAGAHALAERGMKVVASTSASGSWTSLRRGHQRAPASQRRCAGPSLRRRVRRGHLPVPGRLRPAGGPAAPLDADGDVLAGIARALRPGGVAAVSAFSAYFQVRWLEGGDSFDADAGVNLTARRGPRRGRGAHAGRPVDHVLHAPGAPAAGGPSRARRAGHLVGCSRGLRLRSADDRRSRVPARGGALVAVRRGRLLPSARTRPVARLVAVPSPAGPAIRRSRPRRKPTRSCPTPKRPIPPPLRPPPMAT